MNLTQKSGKERGLNQVLVRVAVSYLKESLSVREDKTHTELKSTCSLLLKLSFVFENQPCRGRVHLNLASVIDTKTENLVLIESLITVKM